MELDKTSIVKHHDYTVAVESKVDVHIIESDTSCVIRVYDHGKQAVRIDITGTVHEAESTAKEWVKENYRVIKPR